MYRKKKSWHWIETVVFLLGVAILCQTYWMNICLSVSHEPSSCMMFCTYVLSLFVWSVSCWKTSIRFYFCCSVINRGTHFSATRCMLSFVLSKWHVTILLRSQLLPRVLWQSGQASDFLIFLTQVSSVEVQGLPGWRLSSFHWRPLLNRPPPFSEKKTHLLPFLKSIM